MSERGRAEPVAPDKTEEVRGLINDLYVDAWRDGWKAGHEAGMAAAREALAQELEAVAKPGVEEWNADYVAGWRNAARHIREGGEGA